MPDTPSRLSDMTEMPETAPPRKDVCNASFKDLLAPLAVLMFELTETVHPDVPGQRREEGT